MSQMVHPSAFIVAPATRWQALFTIYTETLHASDVWHPEDWNKVLGLKDIVQVKEFAAQSAVGTGKAIALPVADAFSREVSNALLKLLEEPPKGVRIFLFAESDRMLATIRSRLPVVVVEEGESQRLVQFYKDLNPLSELKKTKKMLYYAPLFHANLQTDVVLDGFEGKR